MIRGRKVLGKHILSRGSFELEELLSQGLWGKLEAMKSQDSCWICPREVRLVQHPVPAPTSRAYKQWLPFLYPNALSSEVDGLCAWKICE